MMAQSSFLLRPVLCFLSGELRWAIPCLFLCALVSTNQVAVAQTDVSIHDIMTTSGSYPLPDSPYLYSHYGSPVSVTGVVVGVLTTGGVYISEPSGDWDSLVATAEGMPIFATAGGNPACAVVGNSVTVIGDVVEGTAITAANTPGTGIQPTSCTVVSTGNTMTQAISIASVLGSFGGALEYTGMAANNSTFYAVSPTGGTLAEATETVTSNGQFWATLDSNTATNNHLFRSPGVAPDEYAVGTSGVTSWTGNPGRILIDTTTFGGTPVDITVGQGITCTVPSDITVGATRGIGLIDYTLGYARLLIFPTSVCTVTGTVPATTSATADATHFHVGTLDLDRFYSTTGATTGSVAVSASAYQRRLSKAANAIVNSLGAPDILSLQEVQDLPTLTDLANAVNTLGGTTYVPYLINTSNDPSSLNLGFLVKSSTITFDSVTQADATVTYTNASGSSATLWERPPVVLTAEVHRTGKTYPVTVLNVHLTPRDNIGDATLGPDIRLRRAAQAYSLSQLVQADQTAGQNVVVAGNFNAFEYSDGFVDVLGVVTGSPAASDTVVDYQSTATTNALTDFTTDVPEYERYNTIERGDAVSFEHILASATVTAANTASASLASYETGVVQPHFSTDFAAVDANTSTTAAGLTPHDGQVVEFLIPAVPTTVALSATTLNFGDVYLGSSATKTLQVTNTSGFTSTVTVSGVTVSGTNSGDYASSSNCTTLAEGASCTVTVTFTPTAVGTRSATLTVATDSASDPSLTAALTGVGVTDISASASLLNFGNVDVGASSAAQTVTITNSTTVAIALTGLTISGDYSETTTCGSTLAAGGTCTVSVVFKPTATGTRSGTLILSTGDAQVASLTVALTGVGVDFSIALAPTSGSVIAGLSVLPVATLTPISGYTGTLTLSCTTTANASSCVPAATSVALSETTSDKVTITTTSHYPVVGYDGFPGWFALLSSISAGLLWRLRRRFSLPAGVLASVALAALSAGLSGCSSKLPDANASYTAPGTYTYTVSATDGFLTHTATYTLTVTAK